jgi:repressor LexA
MTRLTDRQQEVVDFVRQWRQEHGYGPSYRDIADGLIISKTAAIEHVKRLIRMGVLVRTPRRARSIRFRKNGPKGNLSDNDK